MLCWKGETATIKEPGLDLKEKGRVRFTGSELVPYLLSLFQGVFFSLAENIPIKKNLWNICLLSAMRYDFIMSFFSIHALNPNPRTQFDFPSIIW